MLDISGSDWAFWFAYHCRHLADLYATAQHYPPWIYVFLWPLSMFPDAIGLILLGLLSVIVLHRYMGSWWRTIMLLASPAAMLSIAFGNVDSLLVLAFLLPTWAALIVVSCKPVIMLGWAIRSWLQRKSIVQLLPLMIILIASLCICGLWPTSLTSSDVTTGLTINLWWPASIAVGVVLLCTKSGTMWLIGSALLSPYVTVYQLVPILAHIYKRKGLITILTLNIALWYITILQRG